MVKPKASGRVGQMGLSGGKSAFIKCTRPLATLMHKAKCRHPGGARVFEPSSREGTQRKGAGDRGICFLLQPVLLSFIEQSLAADAKNFGRAGDLVVCAFERLLNHLALHLF